MASTVNNSEVFEKMFLNDIESMGEKEMKARWLSREFQKNERLPELPTDVLLHILQFVPKEKRKDAVVVGDWVAIKQNQLFLIQPVSLFIKKNKQGALDDIVKRTFGSMQLDYQVLNDVFDEIVPIEAILQGTYFPKLRTKIPSPTHTHLLITHTSMAKTKLESWQM